MVKKTAAKVKPLSKKQLDELDLIDIESKAMFDHGVDGTSKIGESIFGEQTVEAKLMFARLLAGC